MIISPKNILIFWDTAAVENLENVNASTSIYTGWAKNDKQISNYHLILFKKYISPDFSFQLSAVAI